MHQTEQKMMLSGLFAFSWIWRWVVLFNIQWSHIHCTTNNNRAHLKSLRQPASAEFLTYFSGDFFSSLNFLRKLKSLLKLVALNYVCSMLMSFYSYSVKFSGDISLMFAESNRAAFVSLKSALHSVISNYINHSIFIIKGLFWMNSVNMY